MTPGDGDEDMELNKAQSTVLAKGYLAVHVDALASSTIYMFETGSE